MAGTKSKAKASDRFGGVVGKRASLLTPTEQRAAGILRAIADAELAAARADAAASAQTAKAEAFLEQAEELRAELGKLPDDADA